MTKWLEKANELKTLYPNAEIIFEVQTDVIVDDSRNTWCSSDGQTRLDYTFTGMDETEFDEDIDFDDERTYFKSDLEELVDMFFNIYGHYIENQYMDMIERLPWKEAIVVLIRA